MEFLFDTLAFGTLLAVVFGAVATLLLLYVSRRLGRKRVASGVWHLLAGRQGERGGGAGRSGGRPQPFAEAAGQTGAAEQLQFTASSLQVELQTNLRRARARMEAKLAELDRLISDADRRIAELEELLQIARQQRPSATRHSRPLEQREVPACRQSVPPVRAQRLDGPHRAVRFGGRYDNERLYRRIYALADQGWPAAQIARFVGNTPSEVERILQFRRGDS